MKNKINRTDWIEKKMIEECKTKEDVVSHMKLKNKNLSMSMLILMIYFVVIGSLAGYMWGYKKMLNTHSEIKTELYESYGNHICLENNGEYLGYYNLKNHIGVICSNGEIFVEKIKNDGNKD